MASMITKIKWALIAAALAWSLINAAGLVMAARMGEPIHALVHLVAVVALVGAAYFLKRTIRTKSGPAIQTPPETHILADEVHRLQRELDEAQRGRDFAEQLLNKKTDRPDVS
jgi:hypothetical protein